jgi:hypothetical protein
MMVKLPISILYLIFYSALYARGEWWNEKKFLEGAELFQPILTPPLHKIPIMFSSSVI